jgi:Na+-driven multidrug efflux pump
MGVAGTALASFIAVVAGVLGLIAYVVRKDGYLRFVAHEWRPRFAMWGRMLAIGLPAGLEFALMGAYMAVVYSITRRFGAGAQAGFGIGLRVIQAGFMPVVALGFAVSPVAGQNFGARQAERVRATFRIGAVMATIAMAILFGICRVFPEGLVGLFNDDPAVLAVGGEYLKIVAWNFIPSGIVFVSSSMFQALGNTIPSLVSSFVRTCLLVIPAILMSRAAGFALHWIWYLSVGSVAFHALMNLVLLRREYGRRLVFAPPVAAPIAAAAQ